MSPDGRRVYGRYAVDLRAGADVQLEFEVAAEESGRLSVELGQIVDNDLPALEAKFDAAGLLGARQRRAKESREGSDSRHGATGGTVEPTNSRS